MIDTSREYKEAVTGNDGSRLFCIADRITFADGTQITLSLDDVLAYSINDATSDSGKFQVGAAIIKEYSITLYNDDQRFTDLNFEEADITAKIGLELADGTWEMLQKGTFRIVEAKEVEQTIKVTAYDSMLFFDRSYSESTLSYPATLTEIISDACSCCQMAFDARTVEMGDYTVQERPSDDTLTFRDIISYAAQIMGCYARINRLDKLCFGWYSFENDVNIWGGIFDQDTPYSTGSDLDGGSFSPWNTGDVYSADFASMDAYYHLYDLKTKSINTDDIVITGIQVIAQTGESDPPTKTYGDEGYEIVIENNPLIQDASEAEIVAEHVGKKLRYSCFRPLNVTTQSDPSIEAGDAVIVTVSSMKPSIYTVITNTTFAMGNAQKVECTAETPTEKNYTKYSAQSRILAKSKQATEQAMSVYDTAVQQMNQLAANTMGFYATTQKQADGSIIVYRHNKPLLADSKIVYKSGIDGFWVTQNFQGTDAATTAAGKWESGFDSSGNAVLNMLSVIGINFDWAYGGTLTLGGTGNKNGVMKILDALGAQIGKWDKDGITAANCALNGEFLNYSDKIATSLSPSGICFYDRTKQAVVINGINVGVQNGSIFSLNSTGKREIAVYGVERLNLEGGSSAKISIEDGCISATAQMNVDGTLGASSLYVSDEMDGSTDDIVLPIDGAAAFIEGNLYVSGEKSRVAKTGNYSERLQYCYETTTPTFGDIGTGQINENGSCYVEIDDIFAETVRTDIEYFVFLQKEGQGDLWVDAKEPDYFIVRGTPGLVFSWEIKSVQKGFETLRLDEYGTGHSIADDTMIDTIYDEDVTAYEQEMEELYYE